jgi:hypothetical protein
VRKAKFLSTVAAALLLSAGGALAQGMSKDTPERAPAAQQSAPAEKVAPSIREGQKASPGEKSQKAQMSPDAKSGKARETTGQAPKSDEKSGAMENKSGKGHETTGQAPKSDEKAGQTMENKSGPASGKSDTDRSRSEQNAQSPKGSNGASSTSATTGQGAAGTARLSTEQRTKITTVFKQHRVEPAHLNVSVSVGTRIPTSVHVYPVPTEVVTIYPEWRGYDYILVGDQIVIINPRTHEIIAILEA